VVACGGAGTAAGGRRAVARRRSAGEGRWWPGRLASRESRLGCSGGVTDWATGVWGGLCACAAGLGCASRLGLRVSWAGLQVQ